MNPVALAFHVLLRFESDPRTGLRHLMQTEPGLRDGVRSAAPFRMIADTIRHSRQLDFLVNHCSHLPVERMEREIRVLLRLGMHRLTGADSIPDHAAVNETVALAPKRARGFVNAVLRRAAREGADALNRMADKISDPAVRHSLHPDLVAEIGRFGTDARNISAWLNREPVYHLAPAPGRNAQDLSRRLRALGTVRQRIPGMSLFQVTPVGPAVRALVNPGHAYIQNTASRLVSLVFAHHARENVLDACAAPGTKSLALRALRPDLALVSNDLRLVRLQRIPGAASWHRTCSDARRPAFKDAFDLVLLDAPCTSVGTARKNPDLKLRVDRRRIHAMATTQRGILSATLKRFPTALVLYAVCSFCRAEGEGVLEAMTRQYRFETIDLAPRARALGFNVFEEGMGITLLPTEKLQNDLFYMALIKLKT